MLKFVLGLVLGAFVQFNACSTVGDRVVTAAKVTSATATAIARDLETATK